MKPKTVLIVEDSPTQAFALRKVLEREGLDVLHAPDGNGGVGLARHHKPDAIILDVEMPAMNGLEVCRYLKANARTKHIPVVMLTAHDHISTAAQGLELGAVDFVPKDAFATAVILETLRQLRVLNRVAGVGRQHAQAQNQPICIDMTDLNVRTKAQGY